MFTGLTDFKQGNLDRPIVYTTS